MASITERSNKRNRVQFTVSGILHKTYRGCLAQADQLKVTVDFCRDFERWFSGQLDQVSRDLDRLQSQSTTHSATSIQSTGNVVAEDAETVPAETSTNKTAIANTENYSDVSEDHDGDN